MALTAQPRNPPMTDPKQIAASLTKAQRERAEIRRQALEEAAKACEDYLADCLDDYDIQRRWPVIRQRNAIYAAIVRSLNQ